MGMRIEDRIGQMVRWEMPNLVGKGPTIKVGRETTHGGGEKSCIQVEENPHRGGKTSLFFLSINLSLLLLSQLCLTVIIDLPSLFIFIFLPNMSHKLSSVFLILSSNRDDKFSLPQKGGWARMSLGFLVPPYPYPPLYQC